MFGRMETQDDHSSAEGPTSWLPGRCRRVHRLSRQQQVAVTTADIRTNTITNTITITRRLKGITIYSTADEVTRGQVEKDGSVQGGGWPPSDGAAAPPRGGTGHSPPPRWPGGRSLRLVSGHRQVLHLVGGLLRHHLGCFFRTGSRAGGGGVGGAVGVVPVPEYDAPDADAGGAHLHLQTTADRLTSCPGTFSLCSGVRLTACSKSVDMPMLSSTCSWGIFRLSHTTRWWVSSICRRVRGQA